VEQQTFVASPTSLKTCPTNALKDRRSATEEELDNCVDDAVTGRYSANLDIEE
jgi:hypothetical protein